MLALQLYVSQLTLTTKVICPQWYIGSVKQNFVKIILTCCF
jgi:hypothetical protein